MTLGNRGPIRVDASGQLAADIVEAYWRVGFYVFTGVLGGDEPADIERDVVAILARAPISEGATVDAAGRPALGAGCDAPTFFWSRPLADPRGGTRVAKGRHPARMYQPTPGNGSDFAPFNAALVIKQPGLGASVAWHQDGVTHWDSPQFDQGIHGFNFMAQLDGCTAANGVWVVPGVHKLGKVDIQALVEVAGSDRLPDAVPMIAAPGAVIICNRQTVHGSFTNTGRRPRVTVNFGFHRRSALLGVTAGGVHNAVARAVAVAPGRRRW